MTIDADLYQVGAEWVDRYPDAAEEADTVLPVYPRRWYEGGPTVPLIYAGVGNRDTASSRP
ncbi:hypothetical protein Acsp04_66620 [Actinomadura sp. NBRC 104425]|uniref:hypothetical protein n=1 Tax=Actinomadura sp. NBRC 104425 TaxID=3032204 RepID=UPI0024A2D443|nr:hypothetical protein [Actinomadura sp. NBRC 104425]GLZ16427.1 hypothetical protein Acsp04_66620 [Actinomadura sp. NBRC 104425]